MICVHLCSSVAIHQSMPPEDASNGVHYPSMSSPRDEFVEQVTQIVRARFPLVKLTPGDEKFTVRVNGNLVSLENIYRMTSLKPEEMKHSIERWVVELLRAAEGSPDKELSFEELKERILPMILPENSA